MYEQKLERRTWIRVSIDSETKDRELKEEGRGGEKFQLLLDTSINIKVQSRFN